MRATSRSSVEDLEVAFLMTRGEPGQGVTLLASSGDGYVLYSTIPVLEYLEGGGAPALNDRMYEYATNVMAFTGLLGSLDQVQVPGGGGLFDAPNGRMDIFGSDGDDNIDAMHARSIVHGGDGDDWIITCDFADTVWGGVGADTLWAAFGNDQVWGGAGADFVIGDKGSDFLVGGSGDDDLLGNGGGDSIFGGSGRDQVRGGGGHDWIEGGTGADRLSGGADEDEILGGDDADVIWGGRGRDFLTGGAGADRFYFHAADSGLGVGDADSLEDFDVAGGDLIDLRKLGFLELVAAFDSSGNMDLLIEDNPGTDRVLVDLDGDGDADFELLVETAGETLTDADVAYFAA